MKKSIMYVGLDVHKNTIEIAFAEGGRNDEVRHYGKIDSSLEALDKVIRKLASKGCDLSFVYEAGPCGYDIYRHLNSKGYDCMVVAPSLIPKRSGNRIKNDRRDAQMLARLHRAGELTKVYVPGIEDEAMRELTRAREDAKGLEKKSEAGDLGVSASSGISLLGAIPLESRSFSLDRHPQNVSSCATDRASGVSGHLGRMSAAGGSFD